MREEVLVFCDESAKSLETIGSKVAHEPQESSRGDQGPGSASRARESRNRMSEAFQ